MANHVSGTEKKTGSQQANIFWRSVPPSQEKKPTTKLERKLKRLERSIRKQINQGTRHDVALPITESDITSFMEGKEKINIDKIINFKDNLIQTIKENFTGILSEEQIKALEDTINNLSAYETHRLATDNEGLLDYIYYDYDKWDIRPDAAEELERVVRLINDNEHLSFELSAHTDARGGELTDDAADTLEERIDELIESKKALAASVVGSGEGWLTELGTDELRDLMALRRE